MRLEGLASAMAARRISEEDKAALRDAVELSEFYINKNDTEHLKELDTEFHRIIYRASGGRLLSKILTDMHRNIKAYRKLSLSSPGRIESSVKEHREILEAITSGDAELADKLTSKHIGAAMENLLAKTF
jgi:DNA-binding FadR family transcriptional regulator